MKRFKTELANPDSTILYDDAHWTKVLHDPAYRVRLEREAALLRAEAIRETVVVMGRAVGAVFRGIFRLFTMVAEGSAAVRLYEDLSRLDDAALADLGISRERISQVVVDSMDRSPSRKGAAPSAAALSAIEGGRSDKPAKADRPHRRAA